MIINNITISNLTFFHDDYIYRFVLKCSGYDDKNNFHTSVLFEFFIEGCFTTEKFVEELEKVFYKKVNQKD